MKLTGPLGFIGDGNVEWRFDGFNRSAVLSPAESLAVMTSTSRRGARAQSWEPTPSTNNQIAHLIVHLIPFMPIYHWRIIWNQRYPFTASSAIQITQILETHISTLPVVQISRFPDSSLFFFSSSTTSQRTETQPKTNEQRTTTATQRKQVYNITNDNCSNVRCILDDSRLLLMTLLILSSSAPTISQLLVEQP